jgi:beta-glucanase (GH16 family)
MQKRLGINGLYFAFAMAAFGRAQGEAPTLYEEFNGWSGAASPDGNWRRNGDWTATGGNLFTLANTAFSADYEGKPGGYLTLTVKAGKLEGGEVQTLGGGSGIGYQCDYGYYETRMKLPNVPGICASFFRIGKEYDGNPEIDLEFLTPDFAGTPGKGKVRCMLHPGDLGGPQNLPFNPSEDFHRYGFLFTPQRVQWTADGKVIQTLENVALGGDGIIMMNAWTGNPDWGGGPPNEDVHVIYDWVKYWPGATAIPAEASDVRPTARTWHHASRAYLIYPSAKERVAAIAARPDGPQSGIFDFIGRNLSVGGSFARWPSAP